MSKFSILLKKTRRKLGLTQEDLARELNVSWVTINRWENGKTVPFKNTMMQFVKFCRENNVNYD